MRDALLIAAVGAALLLALGRPGDARRAARSAWHRTPILDTTARRRGWYARLIAEAAGRG